ncbi:MAG: nickel-dependent lactate racemase [Vulcanimicrobiota bacterium]
MNISIPYREKIISLNIPEQCSVTILEPRKAEQREILPVLQKSLADVHGLSSLEDFLNGDGNILCVVNDGTRPTPTSEILECLLEYLLSLPVTFIVATGTHRPPSEDEMAQIFGTHLETLRDKIIIHRCCDDERLFYAGRTSFGTDVYFNRALREFSKVLIITSVEPHYFAGYTGGRKSLNPGLAGEKTVIQNHRLALSPQAEACALDKNPVHLDFVESLSFLSNRIFAVQAVLDRDHSIYCIEAGDLFLSFDAAVRKADEIFCVDIEEKYDIVITVATFPLDIDLYQSQKSIENGRLALKEGGILIFVSSCRKGTGPCEYMDAMTSAGSVDDTIRMVSEGYRFGYHKAGKLAEMMKWSEIWAVTDLEDEVLSSIFIRPFNSLHHALHCALDKKGLSAAVCVLMDGSHVVPTLKGKQKR